MKKPLTVAVILLFIGVSVIPSTGTVVEKSTDSFDGNTLYVGGSGEGNYTKIQDAIDDASDGDTVFVYDNSSPYYENVVIDKSITLIGEDKQTTIIDAGDYGIVVNITADLVNVSGFTIRNSGHYDAGIYIHSNYNTITGNKISNNGDGICLQDSSNNTVTGNNIMDNDFAGIELNSANNSNIRGNNISKNGGGISLKESNNNFISGNNINDNSGWAGIHLRNSSNNKIFDNNISQCGDAGISLEEYCSNNIICGNNISQNRHMWSMGIHIINYGNNNTIANNIIYEHEDDGIFINYECRNSNITENTIFNNKDGIDIDYDCSNNTITGNNIRENSGYGIYLGWGSGNSTITSNDIFDNRNGIWISACDKITITKNNVQNNVIGCGLGTWHSIIEKNNFIGNTRHATHKSSFNNTWDSNYWDNWMGLIGLPLFQKFPKIIFGRWGIIGFVPWLNFDWHPAKEPYDIPGV